MQRLASRCWPQGLHPGGLGWAQATNQLADTIVLLDGKEGDLVGWAGVSQPGYLSLQVAPAQPEVRADLMQWLFSTADGPAFSVDVYDIDTLHDFSHAGFERAAAPSGFYRMGEPGLRAATDGVLAAMPDGYTIRSVGPGEDDERVAVHRAAWRPVELPFHPDHRPDLDESWSSSFTVDAYHQVQRTALYDADLDLVAIAPDGDLAGCCIGWFDASTGWAEIEPLGVVSAHRRRGLAVALCAEVAQRVARYGGRHVFINTGPSESYPAPYRAYRKAGFTPFVRSTTLTRRTAEGLSQP
jgi:GNAT superfamily N-acetyltransferase